MIPGDDHLMMFDESDRSHPGLPIALVMVGAVIILAVCAVAGIAWLVMQFIR